MNDLLTIYRPIGDNTKLLLFCHRLSWAKKATWIWEPYSADEIFWMKAYDAERGITSAFQRRFGSRIVPQVNRNSGLQFNLHISPVLFEDAGIYSCDVTAQAFTYHLVTVKVCMDVSESLTGFDCSISCSVSDTPKNTALVWAKSNGSHLETLNRKQLFARNKENKLKLHVRSGEVLHVACLVFEGQSLVAFIPLQQETLGQPTTTSASVETTCSSTTNNTPSVIVTVPQSLPSISITTNEKEGEDDSLIPATRIICSVVIFSIFTICGALSFTLYKEKRRAPAAEVKVGERGAAICVSELPEESRKFLRC